MPAHFTPSLFAFLRQLKSHNTREWFMDHRDQCVTDVEGPMLAFIGDLVPRMAAISRHVLVDPRRTGGSLFRIYRDTRFSSDKSPYKTHVAAMFPHRERKKGHSAAGFYLHLEPADCLGGGGIYHPDSPTLTRIRLAIVEHGRAWARVKRMGLDIEGDRLQRVPAGFDPAHRYVDDLRRKDHFVLQPFTEAQVCAPGFLDRYVDTCRTIAPLVSFLNGALGLRW